ncbi:MAG: prepilin-type N-terminal cleavage/methylation domain-containing protein [Patescibacteria group bacterium]
MFLKKDNNKGFTLIELLVALSLFSVIVIGMTSTALSVMKGQRKAFSLQTVQEASRYTLESMIKEIRMGVVNSANGTGLSSLDVTNSKGEDVEYQFLANKLRRSINGGAWQDLSSDNVTLTGSFYVRKSAFPNRALVSIVMKIETKEVKTEERSELYIQNSITSRSN